MISVKVTYTVAPEFVALNKRNIQAFMEDFKRLGRDDFRYTVCTSTDERTFVHLSEYQNSDIQAILLNLDTFKRFQEARDQSGLEKEPVIETMSMFATSHSLFS